MTKTFLQALASVALLSYVVALALEAWRPGFVTFFWNPQILLLVAIGGAVLGSFGLPAPTKRWRRVAFFITLAIVGAILVWSAFPPSTMRLIVIIGTILVILGASRLDRHSEA